MIIAHSTKGVRNVTRRFLLTTAGMLLFSITVGAFLQTGVSARTGLRDIAGNWAEEHISSLVAQGVVGGYPDGTFKPNHTITRAEFAKIVVKAFALSAGGNNQFKDMKGHWAAADVAALHSAELIDGYSDDTFRPDKPISRAEVTAIVVRALKLADVAAAEQNDDNSFSDLPADHWAAGLVHAADRLDILPPYFQGRFKPDEKATRAEVSALVNGALRLQIAKGIVDTVDSAEFTLGVKTEQNALRDFSLPPTATIFRNAGIVDPEELRTGDSVYVVADRFGSPVYVKANGLVTQDDVVNKVSSVTKGLLTPEQLKAAVNGNWNAVADGFQVTLYNQLLDYGATPVEADAIMQKDWSSVQGMARERLTKALGAILHLSDDLVVAMMDKDWTRAKDLAQNEAMQALLTRLLFGSQAS